MFNLVVWPSYFRRLGTGLSYHFWLRLPLLAYLLTIISYCYYTLDTHLTFVSSPNFLYSFTTIRGNILPLVVRKLIIPFNSKGLITFCLPAVLLGTLTTGSKASLNNSLFNKADSSIFTIMLSYRLFIL